MEKTPIPEGTKRIISVSFVLIFISSMIVIILGQSMKQVHGEARRIDHFLKNAEGIQINFEQSLQIYTERTKDIMDHLLALRPETKEEYIQFISDVENLGNEMGMHLNLQSVGTGVTTLDYEITFEADLDQTKEFVEELEKMNYFIQIDEIDFTAPAIYAAQRGATNGNVKLKIKLYIK